MLTCYQLRLKTSFIHLFWVLVKCFWVPYVNNKCHRFFSQFVNKKFKLKITRYGWMDGWIQYLCITVGHVLSHDLRVGHMVWAFHNFEGRSLKDLQPFCCCVVRLLTPTILPPRWLKTHARQKKEKKKKMGRVPNPSVIKHLQSHMLRSTYNS